MRRPSRAGQKQGLQPGGFQAHYMNTRRKGERLAPEYPAHAWHAPQVLQHFIRLAPTPALHPYRDQRRVGGFVPLEIDRPAARLMPATTHRLAAVVRPLLGLRHE